jgi:hypothetical protein
MHIRKTAKVSVMGTMPNEPLLRKQDATEYSLKAHRFQLDKCLEQCLPLECPPHPLVSVLQMAIMAMRHHQCTPGLHQPQRHLCPHHLVAYPNARPHRLQAMVALRKVTCLQVSKTLLNSTSRVLLLGLPPRQGLDLQPARQFLHQLSSMVLGDNSPVWSLVSA